MRYLILGLLAAPAIAQAPTVESLVAAYAGAPWFAIADDKGEQYVCIAEADSKRVDWIVSRIAERAQDKCI